MFVVSLKRATNLAPDGAAELLFLSEYLCLIMPHL